MNDILALVAEGNFTFIKANIEILVFRFEFRTVAAVLDQSILNFLDIGVDLADQCF